MMKRAHSLLPSIVSASVLAAISSAMADVAVPSVIGENMVLQQKQKNTIWGWGAVGESVTVSIDRQTAKTTVDG